MKLFVLTVLSQFIKGTSQEQIYTFGEIRSVIKYQLVGLNVRTHFSRIFQAFFTRSSLDFLTWLARRCAGWRNKWLTAWHRALARGRPPTYSASSGGHEDALVAHLVAARPASLARDVTASLMMK